MTERSRFAGVWPKIIHADRGQDLDVQSSSGFRGSFCVRTPNSAPPAAPPTFAHVSTPAAEDAGKPMPAMIDGTHFRMK